jgi:hypothetical protein
MVPRSQGPSSLLLEQPPPKDGTHDDFRRPMMVKPARVLMTALLFCALAIPAAQAEDNEVFASGSCSGRSHWTLELDIEHRVEADFEGHTPRAGQTWRIVMRHGKSVVFRGTRTTENDGDFEVDKTMRNRSGRDRVSVRSVNTRTGEVCKGASSI